MIGDRKLMLGVRVGKPPQGDVLPSNSGMVNPGTGGMSVGRHWKELPHFLIPPRLGHLVPVDAKRRAATGNDAARCWRIGDGVFANANVSSELSLRLENQLTD
jgi:hypothetical protein